jgi:hypothetical protein
MQLLLLQRKVTGAPDCFEPRAMVAYRQCWQHKLALQHALAAGAYTRSCSSELVVQSLADVPVLLYLGVLLPAVRAARHDQPLQGV